MISRIELILRQLAKQHAPHLLAQAPHNVRSLASGLARHGVLVIYFTLQSKSDEEHEQHINNRVSAYANLYTLMTEALFPTFTHISAFDADREEPPVVILQARSAPVTQVFADVLVPFVAVSQDKRLVSDAELRGVMTVMLEELEGQDLPLAQYNAVLREGMLWIRQLLAMPGKQYSLTPFHNSAFRGLPEPQLPPPETPQPEEMPTDRYETVHDVAEKRPDTPQFIPPDTPPMGSPVASPATSTQEMPKPPTLPENPADDNEKSGRSTVPIFYRRLSKNDRKAPLPPPSRRDNSD